MINFVIPTVLGIEEDYLKEAIKRRQLAGDNYFTKKCREWFTNNLGCMCNLLTTSCTAALEMAAILSDIQPGDEVILPSYTFVSTANAFVLRGASLVFVDIRPDTMNIDEQLIEAAITKKTKVIVVVHYAGVACEMDTIINIAIKHNLLVVEDAAQALTSKYKNRPLGTIGHFGCFSFHETKNYTCGEGGALIVNNERYIERAEIIREKGTDRSKFFRGEIDKYTWIDIGSSYLPSELNAAYLLPQLERSEEILRQRIELWDYYYMQLLPLREKGLIELPSVPLDCKHNAHMFYIKVNGLAERTNLIQYLAKNNVHSVFHYIPLHSSPAGVKYGRFFGEDKYTTSESERILRLPIYYELDKKTIDFIVSVVSGYFQINKCTD